MTETFRCPCVRWIRMGVEPSGAHVRWTKGATVSPVSSRKTRCTRRLFVFFMRPHVLLIQDSGTDLLLVALHGPPLRPLGTLSQRME